MATSISDKLKIKEGYSLLTLHAPGDFKKKLTGLPKSVTIATAGKEYDQIHWFVNNKAQLERELGKVMKLVKPGVIGWVYYPKGTSGVQTDLTRDKGWECLLAEGDKLTWISLISFDDTWSVFGFRPKTEAEQKRTAKPKEVREIFNWVDPKTKKVTLPDHLAAALKKDKKVAELFESLSFTNKKEYIEWIVTAKREETRSERLKGTVERLKKGWKNPQNR